MTKLLATLLPTQKAVNAALTAVAVVPEATSANTTDCLGARLVTSVIAADAVRELPLSSNRHPVMLMAMGLLLVSSNQSAPLPMVVLLPNGAVLEMMVCACAGLNRAASNATDAAVETRRSWFMSNFFKVER